ncbi:SDR family NAD(P)-dependent oxidoreductase [Amycolatopsis pithecellobii]|uniref:SDR family oxidoreductase n=1 Tax=Amycolatopsis pithecellobii TaxID=664692 RepID=A0A6N7YUY2_9PSEU|nr:SDR family NAD(P)-dependent oxidoreductase [Amycolatopsis pithecellobii]MTD56887.1 SDR family oxidoreductase [Amycolatopsis pithecellobii]
MGGRIAVVTGGANGIGRAFARRLAADGVSVAVLDRAPAEAVLADIEEAGGKGIGVQVDLTDPAEIATAAEEVGARLGTPQVLVNNVGIYPFKPFEDVTFEEWRKVFEVNVDTLFRVTQAFLPGLTEGGWGRIVNVTSNSVSLVIPSATPYMSSKMAIIGFTRGLATELAEQGVTVNAIAPSFTRTPGTEAGPAEFFDIVPQLQAIKRLQQPEDLAGALSFLVSDDAGFITGQTFYVDGGLVRS